MKPRPVTEFQREILISLHLGRRWGGDDRSRRGLVTRGLVEMRTHSFADITFGRIVTIDLPVLTAAGAREAARLWLQAPIAEKRAARAELAGMGL